MKIQTFSVVVGTNACDAKCPFCVSKQTGYEELPKNRDINIRNLWKAIRLAKLGGTTTALLTGKGEPTLYPHEILDYLAHLHPDIPLIELQTNGKQIGKLAITGRCDVDLYDGMLQEWYDEGLDTIAISAVDIYTENNQKIYGDDYPGLVPMIEYLHQFGFSIRLCIMMHGGMVDSVNRVREVIDFCHEHKVAQLTLRPIRSTNGHENEKISDYVDVCDPDPEDLRHIHVWFEGATKLMTLSHGATIYDVNGQNVCLSDCLTIDPDHDNIRTLIYYGDGRIAYDWQYHGAVFLAPAN
jgi:MoaA/NifB/PqqE/SkfB family radical SAM enzyme